MALAISLCGCGSIKTKTTTTKKEVTAIGETTETATEATATEATETVDLTGHDTFNNVHYKLGDAWKLNNDNSGTRVYATEDTTETVAIYVQNETSYSADQMQDVYKKSIESVYGTKYTNSTETISNFEWNVYKFTTDNTLRDDIGANIYVYSDGKTTIYVEYGYLAANGATDKDITLLENVIID